VDSGTLRSVRLCLAALLGSLAAACSPLNAFDTLVPKDPGGTLVAKGLAYGSGPRQRLDVYAPRGGCRTPAGAHARAQSARRLHAVARVPFLAGSPGDPGWNAKGFALSFPKPE